MILIDRGILPFGPPPGLIAKKSREQNKIKNYIETNNLRSRVTAHADLESPSKRWGLGKGSIWGRVGWSGPTCKIEIDHRKSAVSDSQGPTYILGRAFSDRWFSAICTAGHLVFSYSSRTCMVRCVRWAIWARPLITRCFCGFISHM